MDNQKEVGVSWTVELPRCLNAYAAPVETVGLVL